MGKTLFGLFIFFFGYLHAKAACQLANRLYIGTDLYYRKITQMYIDKSTSSLDGIFKGIWAGYDFISPNSIYWGGEIYKNWDKALEKSSYFQTDIKNDISNYELRGGLTLMPARNCLLSLFVVGGYHYMNRIADDNPSITYSEVKYNWNYLGGGAYITVLLTYFWKISIQGKMMQMMDGRAKIFPKDSNVYSVEIVTDKGSIGKKWQYSIELPNYFYFPKFYPFDIAIVPYINDINMKAGQWMALLNNQEKVYTPSAKQFDYGVKFEIGLNF